jgi:GAF domain-containing protein
MTFVPEPVLQALVEAAVTGTGGTDGWLLIPRGSALEVVAAAGPHATDVLGAMVDADAGAAGFVLGSGQPMALSPRADDPRAAQGVAAIIGHRPRSVLCIPCESDAGVAGVLEIVDKADHAMFSFDDVELATLIAGVGGVALETLGASHARALGPDELAGELRRLAANDPNRYEVVASLIAALLASG